MNARLGQPSEENSRTFPEHVGRFNLLLPIASGGMATVYLARMRSIGGFEREVALKLTHAHLREAAEFTGDLLEEAKLAVRIRHANVVPVLDVGEDPAGVYLVMDYIEGDTLSGLVRRARADGGALPLPIGMCILLDALAGLHAAHELKGDDGAPLGLVHRDFSPQNVLVGIDGVGRLADFGIAKAASRLAHTKSGLVKGKISYMSPEQARGGDVDRRCDLWAAAVVAWELVAGRRLHSSSDNELATLMRIVNETPPLLGSVVRDVPPLLEQAIARALSLDIEARPRTATALARSLKTACVEGGVELAEREDVAAYTAAVVGPKLAERRARVANIVALGSAMQDLRRSNADMRASTPLSSEQPAGGQHFPTSEPPTQVLPVDESSKTAPSVVSAPLDTAKVRSRAILWAAGAATLIGGAYALVSLTRRSPSVAEPSASPIASASLAAAAPSPAPSPDSAASAPVASASASAIAREVTVKANASISTLTVDGTSVRVDKPSRTVRIARSHDGVLHVQATNVEGAKVSGLVADAADSIYLEFPPRATPPRFAPDPYRTKH